MSSQNSGSDNNQNTKFRITWLGVIAITTVVYLLAYIALHIYAAFQEVENATVKFSNCDSDRPPCKITGTVRAEFLSGRHIIQLEDGTEISFDFDSLDYMSVPSPPGSDLKADTNGGQE